MQIKDVIKRASGLYDCMLEHPQFGWIPYTANKKDPECKRICEAIEAGNAGPITDGTPTTSQVLQRHKNDAAERVHQIARNARRQYLTPGKDYTYLAKQQELRAFKTDAEPDPTSYPYLAAEADARSLTLAEAAATISDAVARTDALDAQLELSTTRALASIKAATSQRQVREISAEFETATTELTQPTQ